MEYSRGYEGLEKNSERWVIISTISFIDGRSSGILRQHLCSNVQKHYLFALFYIYNLLKVEIKNCVKKIEEKLEKSTIMKDNCYFLVSFTN